MVSLEEKLESSAKRVGEETGGSKRPHGLGNYVALPEGLGEGELTSINGCDQMNAVALAEKASFLGES